MKRLLPVFLILTQALLFSAGLLQAQTVNVTTAGTLATQLTAAGIDAATVTSLTVTGNINGTDIVTLNTMVYSNSLANVDLSGVVIAGNTIPDYAFYGCTKLKSIIIPNSVTSIGIAAFYQCSSLTSANIPNSVTSIGNSAFSYCTSLTSVSIPNFVTIIGNNSFYHCTSLTSVSIPNSVTSIGNSVFSSCTSLTSLIIPNSVTSIGYSAFSSCTSLTSVSIPNSVTSIGDYAFSSCTSLTSLIISNSVTSIGNSAFYKCSSLTSLIIPNSVTSIGDYAFSSCSSLTSLIISNSVTSIGDYAFYQCSSLTSVSIPNSVTSIGEYAFYYCTSLTSVSIPNSVTSIGYAAFQSCTSLTSVNIPNSVTSIGDYAFFNCPSNLEVNEYSKNPSGISLGSSAFSSPAGSKKLHVPVGSVSAFSAWSSYFTIIDDLPATGTLTLTPASISLPCTEASTATATITSNIHWGASVASGTTWLSVSPNSGAASSNTLTITAAANISTVARTATITVTTYDGAASQTITVTQTGTLTGVTTQGATNITTTTATGNGTLTNLGSPNPSAYGICYSSANAIPTIADSKTDKGATSALGAFTSQLTGLVPGTRYYVRAYATNAGGTSYGDLVTFTTPQIKVSIVLITGKSISGVGDVISFTLSFNSNIIVTGTPVLTIGVGETKRNAAYVSGSGTPDLVFTYTVAQGDEDTDGVMVGELLTNGGSLIDNYGNKAPLISINNSTSKRVDGIAPSASITAASSLVYGASVPLTINFSEPVTGFTVDDVLVTNASKSNFSGSGTTYTLDIMPINAGTVTIAVPAAGSQDAIGNLNSAATSVHVSVDKIKLTATNPSLTLSKTYDSTPVAAVTAGSLTNKLTGDDVSVTATASYNDASVATGKTITVAYSLSGASASNYTAPDNYVVNAGEIKAFKLIATNPSLTLSKTYDGTPAAAATAGSLNNKVTGDDVSVTATASYNDASVATGKTITVVYSLSGASASNYSVPDNYVVNTGEIKPLKLTATNPSLTLSKTYDGTPTAEASAGSLNNKVSGDNVSVMATASYNDASVATGKTITVAYSLSGASASNYTVPDNYVVNTGEITPLKLTVTNPSLTLSKTYDGNTTAAVAAGALTNKLTGDDVSVTATASYNNASVATGKTITVAYSLSGASASNYTVPDNYIVNTGEIKALKLIATNPSLTLSKTYDGTPAAAATAGSLNNKVTGDDVSVTATASYNDASVATGKTIIVVYSLSGASASNYTAPDNYVVNTGEITPLKLTVTNPSLTLSKTYDGTPAAAATAGSLNNKVTGDDVSVTATASYNDASVATGKTITVAYSLSGASASNYTAPDNYVVNTGEIKAFKLTATNPSLVLSKPYDGNITASVTAGTMTNKVTGDDVSLAATASYNDASIATGKTITVAYSLSGASASNYVLPDNYVVNTGAITPLKLSVTNPSLTLSKTYDGNITASVTAGTITNKVTGDNVSVTATASYNDASVATGKTITVAYSLSGASASNYTVPDNYTVNAGEITPIKLSATNPSLTLSKTYDGNTTAAVSAGALTNKLTGDDVSITATASYNEATASTGKTITVNYSLSGSDASNYTAPDDYAVTTGVIIPAPLTISLTAQDKPYDGNTQAAVIASITQGMINGDDVTALASNGQFDNANVGHGKTVTAAITLTGTDAANYSSSPTATTTASVVNDTYPVVSFTVTETNGNIHTSSTIEVSFTEPVNMVPATLKEGLVLREGNASGAEVDFTATGFSAMSVSHFSLTGNFECGKSYYLAVKAGAFTDLSGNPVALTEKTLRTDALPEHPVIAGATASVCPGSTISLKNYNDKISYQWQFNGQPMTGQTADKYQVSADGSGDYSVLAVDLSTGCQNSSDPVSVNVYPVVIPVVYEKNDKNIVSLLIVDNSANTFTTYAWTLADGSPLPSGMVDNRQFLTVTATDMNKQYIVQTTDRNGCIARSDLASITVTAASSLVYPTLNNGAFKIDVSSAESGKVSIRIMSQTGIMIKQYVFYKEQGQATFDIHPGDMVAGKYLVEISTGSFRDVKNIVVE